MEPRLFTVVAWLAGVSIFASAACASAVTDDDDRPPPAERGYSPPALVAGGASGVGGVTQAPGSNATGDGSDTRTPVPAGGGMTDTGGEPDFVADPVGGGVPGGAGLGAGGTGADCGLGC